MESKILSAIGMDIDPGILFLVLFFGMVIMAICLFVLLVKYGRIRTSYETFMQGKKGKNLEEQIAGVFEDIEMLKSTSEKSRKDQRVGIVKYDAFKEMGGKLSFSIALLNDNSTGFILNSVHSSDGCYVYTKEIINGECAISLGDEEKKALTLALQEDAAPTEG